MTADDLTEVRTLRCRPGDVVIIHYRENIPSQAQIQAVEQLTSTLPDGVRVLVAAGDLDIIRATMHTDDD